MTQEDKAAGGMTIRQRRIVCEECEGDGEIATLCRTPDGPEYAWVRCWSCSGAGILLEDDRVAPPDALLAALKGGA